MKNKIKNLWLVSIMSVGCFLAFNMSAVECYVTVYDGGAGGTERICTDGTVVVWSGHQPNGGCAGAYDGCKASYKI